MRKNGHLILVLSNTAYEWLTQEQLSQMTAVYHGLKMTSTLSRDCHHAINEDSSWPVLSSCFMNDLSTCILDS